MTNANFINADEVIVEIPSSTNQATSSCDDNINNNNNNKTIVIRSSTFPDRWLDTASLIVMLSYCFLWFIALFCALVVPWVALAWTGVGALLLIQNTHIIVSRNDNADIAIIISQHGRTLTFCFMGICMALSIAPWHPLSVLMAVLAVSVILLQSALLLWTLYSWSPADTIGQRAFYASLHVWGAVFTILSMWNVFASFVMWPSAASFDCALSSFLIFAYVSWLGSISTGIMTKCPINDDDRFIFSCSNCSTDHPNVGFYAVVALLIHFPTALMVVPSNPLNLLFLTLLFVFNALYFRAFLRVPIRLYVRSDACIVIQFLRNRYVYGKAVRVYDAPAIREHDDDESPQKALTNTDKCHVYVEYNRRRVIVELTQQRSLVLTPQLPDDFMSAVAHTIIGNINPDNGYNGPTKNDNKLMTPSTHNNEISLLPPNNTVCG